MAGKRRENEYGLTSNETQTLVALLTHAALQDRPYPRAPTIQEVADMIGLASKGPAYVRLKHLVDLGLVSRGDAYLPGSMTLLTWKGLEIGRKIMEDSNIHVVASDG